MVAALKPSSYLAACVQLSLAGPHLAPGSQPAAPPPMTLSAFGMNLHAATTADGRDRKQLERICRYLLRPPFAHDAVTALPGGRVRVSFKAPWRSGTAYADMDAQQFLARLCALVPPPGPSGTPREAPGGVVCSKTGNKLHMFVCDWLKTCVLWRAITSRRSGGWPC